MGQVEAKQPLSQQLAERIGALLASKLYSQFDFDLTWQVQMQMAQTPSGPRPQPQIIYTLLLTRPSPVLGQRNLNFIQLPHAQPTDDELETLIRTQTEAMNTQASEQLKQSFEAPTAPGAPGLVVAR